MRLDFDFLPPLFPLFELMVFLLVAGAAFAGLVAYGVATMRYRLGEAGLEILVLGVTFRTIPYGVIEGAWRGGSLFEEHWVTFALGNRVTLALREGGRRRLVISPPDPAGFLRALEERLPRTAAPRAEGPEGRTTSPEPRDEPHAT